MAARGDRGTDQFACTARYRQEARAVDQAFFGVVKGVRRVA